MDVNVRQLLDMITELAEQSMKMNAIMIGATLGFTYIVEQAVYGTRKVRCPFCFFSSKQVRRHSPLDFHSLLLVS